MKASKTINTQLQNFDSLPDSAFVRFPVTQGLFACSASTVWRGVKEGWIPAPYKLSSRTTAWNVGDLRKFLGGLKGGMVNGSFSLCSGSAVTTNTPKKSASISLGGVL